jgi:hypothetical protein
MDKQPAHTFKAVKFPECSSQCALVEYLGVGECESACPWKFNLKTGNALETFTVPTDTDIIFNRITKPKGYAQ